MKHWVPTGWSRVPQGRAPHGQTSSQPPSALLALVLLLAACGVAPPSAVARATPESFSPLVKRVLPSVVNIAVTETVSGKELLAEVPPELRDTPLGREFRRKFGDKHTESTSAGSGFIIDSSGVIVTNRHVIEHASKIEVALADGSELPARVIGSDELTDVAVIQVATPHSLPAVAWGDSRVVEVGDWILAAGNPFGLGGSVTAGIVSAMGRDLGAGPFDNFLQLDAPINPGNSGGPTFNMDGAVVGMTTAIVSPSGGSVGIGFAIPSEIIRPIVAELRAKGRVDRGWLGVALRDTDSAPGDTPGGTQGRTSAATSGGATIAVVERDGPALRAGLHVGDVVVAVNGEPIDGSRGLIRAVAAAPPGASVRLRVRRQSRELEIPVTVGRRPDSLTE
jgi:serine protease Do